MKDGASVNQAGMERIKSIFPKVFSVVCFSYTLDNVGNHFQIPALREFSNLWIRMFSHSHKAKLLWQEQTGRKPKSYSETPWWSKWEVYQQLLVQLDDVRGFIQQVAAENIAPQIVAQIQDILSDEQGWINLQLELAAVVDIGEQFVKSTYYLEGDGPLAFS